MAAKQSDSKTPLRLFRRWPLTSATLALGGLALGALAVSACDRAEDEMTTVAQAEDARAEDRRADDRANAATDKSKDEFDAPILEARPEAEEEATEEVGRYALEAEREPMAPPPAGMAAEMADGLMADDIPAADPAAVAPMGGVGTATIDGKSAGAGSGYRGGEAKAKPARKYKKGRGAKPADSDLEGFADEWDGEGGGFDDGRFGKYDNGIQARQLTAGTQDDVSDSQGYAKYLSDSQMFIDRLDLPQSYLDIKPNLDRHDEQPRSVQIALVIDTTSSMSDELEYLKVEMRTIAEKVHHEFPGVEQEFALIAYRDQGDEYVVHAGGFQSLHGFVDDLGQEFSGGGGDYPEAMDQAMENASQLKWDRSGKTAKMVFLVADAPPHHGSGVSTFLEEVEVLRGHDVAMYPVAASGVDNETELLMRTSAHATGGQYIFLTDHSGIGHGHKDPNVDQYKVETLHDAMLRMIRTELGAEDTQRPVLVDQQHDPQVDVNTQLVVPEPEMQKTSFFGRLVDALGDHFGFAAIFALGLFAAIGVDATFGKKNKS